MDFFNIKLHTDYSILKSCVSIEEYIRKAKETKQKVLAITDDSLFGAMKFYNSCKKNDIKPIIGLQLNILGINLEGKYALSIFAKNEKGYKNICNLSTLTYEKELSLYDILPYLDNLFVLSGGVNSEIVNLILDNKKDLAKKTLLALKEKIKDIYFEIPIFDMFDKQREYFYEIYKETKTPAILTNDVFYLEKEDHIISKIFSAIKENTNIDLVKSFLKQKDLYFKDKIDTNIFEQDLLNEAMSNLKYLVDNCNLNFSSFEAKLPNVQIDENLTKRAYIEKLINMNLKKKYPNNTEIANKRVKYELDIIEKMGYIDYFLIVYDFIKYAKENNIYVGPGRGSAAGSIISYLLNITEIDPLKYDLIFERFLNPDRISMPDIDVDVEQERRMDLIEYIKNKYSKFNVSQLITYATFKPALALKDVARVLKIKESNIRSLLDIANEKGLDNLSYINDDLIKYAKKIENKIKNVSTHAAGIIITKENMKNNLPLMYEKYSNDYQIQYDASILETMGYLKIDILGLKNLNIIKTVKEKLKIDVDVYNLPYEEKAFEIFDKGNTLGIFQCESKGISKLAKELKIKSIDDIALLLALYRPGPLESGYIPLLIKRKNFNGKISYLHPILEEILAPTYGVLVYQEQVMQIARKVSNYSLAGADELRKAIGKKNKEILKKNREIFINNSIIDKKIASKIYDLIENFGNYGFNKAHAISYANITYQTVYLKYMYPLHFYCSVLSSELKQEKKLNLAYQELKQRGIKILPPDINKSSYEYIIEGNNIRMPLSALKDMSEKTAKEIVKQRNENGYFKDIIDFAKRCNKLDKSNLTSLTISGAFDCFNISRKGMIPKIPLFQKYIQEELRMQEDIRDIIFEVVNTNKYVCDIPYRDKEEEFDIYELMEKEKEYFKLNLRLDEIIENKLMKKLMKKDFSYVIGYIENVKNIITKKNELMAKVNIYADYKNLECVIFPNVYLDYSHLLEKRNIALFKIKRMDNFKYSINEVIAIDDFEKFSLNIKIDDLNNFNKKEFFNILSKYKGNKKSKIYIKKNAKYELVNLDDKYMININEELLNELINLLGVDNIKLVLELKKIN